MNALIADVLTVERTLLRTGESVLLAVAAFGEGLAGSRPGGAADLLSAEEREQIRMTAWRLQNAFEEVTRPRDEAALWEALRSLSFLAESFADALVAWTEVMDELVEEAERLYGTASGRGAYKREQVRAAVLTIARREKVELPLVPGFAEPLVFMYLADFLADFVVTHLNDNALWDYESLPERPVVRARLGGPVLYYLQTSLGGLSRFLTGLAWRIALRSTRLSPRMLAAVDRVHPDIAGVIEALVTLSRFAAENSDWVRAAARLFSIAVQQAESFAGMSGPRKQAYARALILDFLEQNGLFAESGLWRQIVGGWLNVGIDATVRLFNRRQLFPFHAPAR